MNNIVKCHGCLGEFQKSPELWIPHSYIGAIKECWLRYSEILAKEFNDKEYFKAHRITVDSYAAQHIGDQKDRRARQSANLHLIALYLYVDRKLDVDSVLQFLKNATVQKRDWPPIGELKAPTWLTVNDIIKAKNATEHIAYVQAWGKSVWDAYSKYDQDIIYTYETAINAC